ncbi:TPA: thioredoxin-related transmembrane protein 4-like [Bos taurus]|nr:TPA: thioredoxin-related transmembrane protein 4-like [Bos taurus]
MTPHLHNYFTVSPGVPAWYSYVFFFITATLIFGLFMGLVLVVISECFYLPLTRNYSKHSEQNLRSEEVHITEQLQDVEEEKDDSNGEENKDSLADDEDEKEALGYEKEAEEDEEDSSAAGVDEEKSDTRDQGSLMEAQEDEGPSEMEDDTPQQPHPAGAEAVEDSLRQHRSQHAERGPSA